MDESRERSAHSADTSLGASDEANSSASQKLASILSGLTTPAYTAPAAGTKLLLKRKRAPLDAQHTDKKPRVSPETPADAPADKASSIAGVQAPDGALNPEPSSSNVQSNEPSSLPHSEERPQSSPTPDSYPSTCQGNTQYDVTSSTEPEPSPPSQPTPGLKANDKQDASAGVKENDATTGGNTAASTSSILAEDAASATLADAQATSSPKDTDTKEADLQSLELATPADTVDTAEADEASATPETESLPQTDASDEYTAHGIFIYKAKAPRVSRANAPGTFQDPLSTYTWTNELVDEEDSLSLDAAQWSLKSDDVSGILPSRTPTGAAAPPSHRSLHDSVAQETLTLSIPCVSSSQELIQNAASDPELCKYIGYLKWKEHKAREEWRVHLDALAYAASNPTNPSAYLEYCSLSASEREKIATGAQPMHPSGSAPQSESSSGIPPKVSRRKSSNIEEAGLGVGHTRARRGQNSISVSDAVYSEAQFLEILARLETEDRHDPLMRAHKTEAAVPDMALDLFTQANVIADWNMRSASGIVSNPDVYYGALSGAEPRTVWTSAEEDTLKYRFVQQPKQFGYVAKHLPHKTMNDAVSFYYRSKYSIDYRGLFERKRGGFRGRGRNSGRGNRRSEKSPDEPQPSEDTPKSEPQEPNSATEEVRPSTASETPPAQPAAPKRRSSTPFLWTPEERETMLRLLPVYGRDWTRISQEIPGKTPVQCRNWFQNNARRLNLGAIAPSQGPKEAAPVKAEEGEPSGSAEPTGAPDDDGDATDGEIEWSAAPEASDRRASQDRPYYTL